MKVIDRIRESAQRVRDYGVRAEVRAYVRYARWLWATSVQRRDTIVGYYLAQTNPIDDFAVSRRTPRRDPHLHEPRRRGTVTLSMRLSITPPVEHVADSKPCVRSALRMTDPPRGGIVQCDKPSSWPS